jgi:type III secretion protein V
MFDRLTRFLTLISGRGDLVIGILVLVSVLIMILPLPTPLVDVLITANIAASVLILLTAIYVVRPIEFSSLPSIILIATLFRLAITITTSRLVLLQADAGDIINAFGSFVIGGNLAVGLVIFLIITIAQFVVITKGSERVAEVAARFSLDALPGKQMSIDSDLRNGDINQAEARLLRHTLERESHLYGAMDGAAKFVKGDAIASIVVILVNLLGGFAVGMLQHGMSLAAAAETYSLLTVGDGLVAQIPALLVSVAAGTVVTRVGSEDRRDLGADITAQLINNPRVLGLAAAIVFGLAFIPGFPAPAFLVVGAGFAAAAFWVHRRASENVKSADPKPVQIAGSRKPDATAGIGQVGNSGPVGKSGAGKVETLPPRARVIVFVGRELVGALPIPGFSSCAERVREQVLGELGVIVPAIQLCVDEAIEPHGFHIDLEGVAVAEAEIPADSLLVEGGAVYLDLHSIPYWADSKLARHQPVFWVDRSHEAALSDAGVRFGLPLDVLARCLEETLKSYAAHFVGTMETRALLGRMEPEYAELVKEAQGVAPLPKIAEILRRLAEEGVPIRNLRLILEALIEWGPREPDAMLLLEYVRVALRRQICARWADRNRVIAAYVLARSVEELVRSAVHPTTAGHFLSVSEEALRPAIESIRHLTLAKGADAKAVVLTSMDARRHVRTLLTRNEIELPVMSFQEVAPEFSVQPLATIGGQLTAGSGSEIAGTQLAFEPVVN